MYTKREILKQERILSILQRRDLHETKSLVPQCMQSTSDLRNNHSDANEALTLLDSRLIAWPSLDCSFAQWSDAPTQLYFEHNVTLPTWNSGGFRLAQTRTMHAASVLFDPLVSAHGETISAPQILVCLHQSSPRVSVLFVTGRAYIRQLPRQQLVVCVNTASTYFSVIRNHRNLQLGGKFVWVICIYF
jgi:hypothetical protein